MVKRWTRQQIASLVVAWTQNLFVFIIIKNNSGDDFHEFYFNRVYFSEFSIINLCVCHNFSGHLCGNWDWF